MKQQAADLERLSSLVSSRTGLVKRLIPLVKGAPDPTPPFVYCALLADCSDGLGKERMAGVGKGVTRDEAKVRALGEAVERYCATQPNWERTVRASRADLGPQALDPTDCVLYSDRQYAQPGFGYTRYSRDTKMTWTYGTALLGREVILVPAILVYLTEMWEQHDEHICCPGSNGLATGVTLDNAILNGLFEVIERDAFMVSWLSRRPCHRIDFSRQQGLLATIGSHYLRFGIEVVVVELTTDLPVYVMMALAVDRGGVGPATVIGLGAGLDPAFAIEKALFEVCQARPGEATKYRMKPPEERLRTFEHVHDVMDHSALFSMRQMLGELDFLLAPDPVAEVRLEELPDHSTGSVEMDIEFCVDALADVGSKVMYVDVTTPDIAPLGLRTVRTIATGLQPIHFGYGEDRLGGRRLFELPMKLGYSPRPLTEADINPCPHPLA
jgi:ribosomal protein S12 methylthiotransferase accessory factor